MNKVDELFSKLAEYSSELTLSGKRWYNWSNDGAAKQTIIELGYNQIEDMSEEEADYLLNTIDFY